MSYWWAMDNSCWVCTLQTENYCLIQTTFYLQYNIQASKQLSSSNFRKKEHCYIHKCDTLSLKHRNGQFFYSCVSLKCHKLFAFHGFITILFYLLQLKEFFIQRSPKKKWKVILWVFFYGLPCEIPQKIWVFTWVKKIVPITNNNYIPIFDQWRSLWNLSPKSTTNKYHTFRL